MFFMTYDFWSHKSPGSTKVLLLARLKRFSRLGHSEIADFDVALIIEKQVLPFDVFMHKLLLVHFFKPKNCTCDDKFDLLLCESTTLNMSHLAHIVREISSCHHVHRHVNVFVVLEDGICAQYEGAFQSGENFLFELDSG